MGDLVHDGSVHGGQCCTPKGHVAESRRLTGVTVAASLVCNCGWRRRVERCVMTNQV